MINYWWVTRPKRKLNSIPEILACCASVSLNCEWQGHVYTHLAFEQALEESGLKRVGDRRDQRGGGGRTYFAWLESLGLVFIHEATGQTKLTLAGEAIVNGGSPVAILKNQILKYQFPSAFSLSLSNSKAHVNERFRIKPFIFLLQLLRDPRLGYYLTQEEIAKIVITEAERNTQRCVNHIVDRILQFRSYGDAVLAENFYELYAPSSRRVNPEHPFSHLLDVANTIINWLEYTQLILRGVDDVKGTIAILPECEHEVDSIIAHAGGLIDRPEEQEYFQRKYGLDPNHQRDNRNLMETRTVTARILDEQKIRQAFITRSLRAPLFGITAELVDIIADATGVDRRFVEDTLRQYYPHGAVGAFMTEYFELAFKGRDEATEFEEATVALFRDAFHYNAEHVGPIGRTPDVLLVSDSDGYQAIIDNKAYSRYTISNDHHNRMVRNYIGNLNEYSDSRLPLAFFSYIAGGFGTNIDSQLHAITDETHIPGSAVSVHHIIKMIENNQTAPYSHEQIRNIFSLNRQITLADL